VEDVGCDEVMDISLREVIYERLEDDMNILMVTPWQGV